MLGCGVLDVTILIPDPVEPVPCHLADIDILSCCLAGGSAGGGCGAARAFDDNEGLDLVAPVFGKCRKLRCGDKEAMAERIWARLLGGPNGFRLS